MRNLTFLITFLLPICIPTSSWSQNADQKIFLECLALKHLYAVAACTGGRLSERDR